MVHDPDGAGVVVCFLPETGNIGTGGGAYLLLDACPGCGGPLDETNVAQHYQLEIKCGRLVGQGATSGERIR